MVTGALIPALFVTVSVTLKPPGGLEATYRYVGLASEDVPDPSPKFQDQIGLQPGEESVLVLVNENVDPG